MPTGEPVQLLMVGRIARDYPAPVTSFHVLPDQLTAAAGALRDVAGELTAEAADAAQAPVSQSALARIPEAAALHRALEASASRCSSRLGEIRDAVTRAAAGATYSGKGYAKTDASVAASYRQALARNG